jgi:hypothetical protein
MDRAQDATCHVDQPRNQTDWKWPSRCCCRSAAGPMPAVDPRRTMHQRQLQLALQHACPQSSFRFWLSNEGLCPLASFDARGLYKEEITQKA